MAFAVVGGVAAGLGSSLIGGYFSNKAANKQADAANNAADLSAQTTDKQLAQQQKMYDANVTRMQPFADAGRPALQTLATGTSPGGQFTKTFDGSNFDQDPSYKWRLDQGMKALQASNAAKGTAGSTQGMRDIINYGQGAASQEYQNAYARFQDTNNTLFNRLNTMAGNSQNAAAGVAANGTQVSSNMANTAMNGANAVNGYNIGGANASAAGAVGMGNAITSGIGTGMNAYLNQQYLNQLNKSSGGMQMAPTNTGTSANDAGLVLTE